MLFQVTLFLVSELLWMQGVVVVNGALEESDSQEHTPFYESHNHINEHDHFHEDGYCDCNSQGSLKTFLLFFYYYNDEDVDWGELRSIF